MDMFLNFSFKEKPT